MCLSSTVKQPNWLHQLIQRLSDDLTGDSVWAGIVDQIRSGTAPLGIHLAIFVEPYLQYILDGKKTVESRFGLTRRPPFDSVREGDIVFLKRSGGPVCGVCEVEEVWFYRLDKQRLKVIKEQYAAALCAQDPTFWKSRSAASFVTLMKVKNARRLTPFAIPKRDRRGWVQIAKPIPRQDVLFA